MKKGQTQMIFMFILAVIIMGLIVLLGYKGITTITRTSDTAALDSFVKDLKSDVSSIYRMRRSSKLITYKVPSQVHQVCLVSSDYNFNDASYMGPAAVSAYEPSKIQLFLLSQDGIVIKEEQILNNVIIDTDDDENTGEYFCKTNKGRIDLRLEGGGNHIIITEG